MPARSIAGREISTSMARSGLGKSAMSLALRDLASCRGRELLRLEVVALVGFEAARQLRPSSRSSRHNPRNGIPKFLGDDVDNSPQQLLANLVFRTLAHHLQVLSVVINVDVAPLGNRVDELS